MDADASTSVAAPVTEQKIRKKAGRPAKNPKVSTPSSNPRPDDEDKTVNVAKNPKNRSSGRTTFAITVKLAARQRETKFQSEIFSENMMNEPATLQHKMKANFELNPSDSPIRVKAVGRASKRVLGEAGGRYKKNFAHHRHNFLLNNQDPTIANVYDNAASDRCLNGAKICLTCCIALSTMKCSCCLAPLCGKLCHNAHKELCNMVQ
uniref:HIT-type domain-containing protein n=1 Tax=Panagrolaimus sp. JU765 TaxID=591449 RepID=A0AC34Q3W6_9BILA